MDFCQLLHKAQKNDQNSSNRARYYSTKFEAPKKIKKENKDLSDNIKKFLAKKEAEEAQKRLEEQRKKEELLALRSQDKKATRRVNVMLKRTKSANQSVLDDATDNQQTAVTKAGLDQPDEDDYGYVSQEASALYEKMMEKYSQMPEEPKFNLLKKKVSSNLNNTKDRVRAALEKEREEAMQPHRRKRKKKDVEEDNKNGEKADSPERTLENKQKDVAKPKKPRPAAPPPMSFTDLLKIAAQKQHEPIIIEEKPQEEEKLYTKKQKKELEFEREWRKKRENRHKEMDRNSSNLAAESKILEKALTKSTTSEKPTLIKEKDKLPLKQVKFASSIKKPSIINNKSSNSKNDSPKSLAKVNNNNASSSSSSGSHRSNVPSKSIPPRKNDIVPKKGILGSKLKEFPPRDLLPKPQIKQFPPPDVRDIKRKKPIVASRGRIIDDDDSEYDSELDDFIDDGDEGNDYSSYIKEIFGYDKSRYKGVDEEIDNMEASFAQQMKEEAISTKIGIMEDLEDIKKEEEEKRLKALRKKKMRR
ncbi:unnamed protein product [Ceutorhynchus assimilis]|uniref:Protein SPT2 homolog n=1 Tax=Ceutorhynchus assimilis TaxID=467358 RepID=A0A9N9QEZ1_9CUCU|nr:unnamed protein product [Ceutorhynchus assimilis]